MNQSISFLIKERPREGREDLRFPIENGQAITVRLPVYVPAPFVGT